MNDFSPEIRHKLYKFLYGETLFPNADGTETQSTDANEEVKESPAIYPEKNYQDFYLDYIDKLKGNTITPSIQKTLDENDETPDNN